MITMESKVEKLEVLLEKMKRIGIQLSAEKDTTTLIRLILTESMEIVGCDAGSIYIKEKEEDQAHLKFISAMNRSCEFPYEQFTLPIDEKSIAGFCALTGKSYIFNSINDISTSIGITYNDYFDNQVNYSTRNMMVIPMKDIHNEVVGVLQLINKKRHIDYHLREEQDYQEQIIDFDVDESDIIEAIASQTAILLERGKLYESIKNLFDNFIESMVTVIDKRDPTTSGHSLRVAEYVKAFAKVINEVDSGVYENMSFTPDEINELYYASLLHDIGKIGISEYILCKETKLDEKAMETIKYRFLYLKKSLEIKALKGLLTEEEKCCYEKLDEYYSFVQRINRSFFLENEDLLMLEKIGSITGDEGKLLSEDDVINLGVKYGNLNPEERKLMNLHAAHTYDILEDIPWPSNLKRIPQIASAHHEKLDGSGYPWHLKGDDIFWESKLIAVADVFEALTAIDRPYRKRMTIEKAIAILRDEVERNHLDKDLVELFIEKEVYKSRVVYMA